MTKESVIPKDKILPIIEIYPCIQTEGSKAGIPHFMIRTTGCTHRCYFGKGGWCDTWYSSINPEKGSFTLEDIKVLFLAFPYIDHLMISGGSPTMHRDVVNEIINLAHEVREMFVTMETEGSHYIETDHKIDLLSISPKFANSVPRVGEGDYGVIFGPKGNVLKAEDIDGLARSHNRYRLNHDAIGKMILFHRSYHFKPVVDRNDPPWDEIEEFIIAHNIPKKRVWVMPAGDTRESITPNYSYVINECVRRGYNFTGRAHIIAFNTERGV